MAALFLLADPDFIPMCCDEEMEPMPELCGLNYLTYECEECGELRYFDAHTAEDITEEMR